MWTFGSTRKSDQKHSKILLGAAKKNSFHWSSGDSGQPENFRVHQEMYTCKPRKCTKVTRINVSNANVHVRVNPKSLIKNV